MWKTRLVSEQERLRGLLVEQRDEFRAKAAEQDAEITRLRGVIAQLREDWRPKAQQEVAAMTAAREVARCRLLYTTLPALDTGQAAMATSALDRLIEALRDG